MPFYIFYGNESIEARQIDSSKISSRTIRNLNKNWPASRSIGESWCPRRDSNPHDRFQSQDFKSCVSAIPPLGLEENRNLEFRIWNVDQRFNLTRDLILQNVVQYFNPYLSVFGRCHVHLESNDH